MKYQEPGKLSDSKLKEYHWWLHSRYSREDVDRRGVTERHTEAVRVMEFRGVKHPGRDKLDRGTVDDFAQSVEEECEQVDDPKDEEITKEPVEEARRLDDTYKSEYFEKWMDWDRHVRAWNVLKPYLVGQSFLDVGCGMGFALKQLQGSGYRVRGTEVSPWAIGFCAGLGLEVDKANATKLPYEDGSFDTVFSMFLLNNLPNQEKAIAESVRVAKMRAVHLISGELGGTDEFKAVVHDKLAAKSEQE